MVVATDVGFVTTLDVLTLLVPDGDLSRGLVAISTLLIVVAVVATVVVVVVVVFVLLTGLLCMRA